MIGWTMAGNFWAEKKTPDAIHIGIIVKFISPEAASIVRAREAMSSPRALKESEPKMQSTARSASEP